MFDFLTLSVVIDDRIFCVHGGMVIRLDEYFKYNDTYTIGLSPSIHSIDQIKVVDRFRGMAAATRLFLSLGYQLACRNTP
jgi:serine/threonine-protein phosphatase PPG1